jgi:hypothetical protein
MIFNMGRSLRDEPNDSSQQTSNGRKLHELITSWVGAVVGAAALTLSIFNSIALNKKPDVDIALPHVVRIRQLPGGTKLYIQPALHARSTTERSEVIKQVELRLRPAKAGVPEPAFFWYEISSLTPDPNPKSRYWYIVKYLADPTPLLINKNRPQLPTLQFMARNWTFPEGRYEGSLILQRASEQGPLTQNFCLFISHDAVEDIRSDPSWLHDFRDNVPGKQRADSKGCYVLNPLARPS